MIELDNGRPRETILKSYRYGSEKTWEDVHARICFDDRLSKEEQQFLFEAANKGWIGFSTPILTNMGIRLKYGKIRGLPISCYIPKCPDTMVGINGTNNEISHLLALGGGVGSDWDDVREQGALIAGKGASSGVMSFLAITDMITSRIKQGGIRRGSTVVTLSITHPDIIEFIEGRNIHGGVIRGKIPELFTSVSIPDKVMESVKDLGTFHTIGRKDKAVKSVKDSFEVWSKILEERAREGAPFLFFKDNANKNCGKTYLAAIAAGDMSLTASNLCQEIITNNTADKTGTCCLLSLNVSKWDDFVDQLDRLMYICMKFLDNVYDETLTCIRETNETEVRAALQRVVNFIEDDGSIGIGQMGIADLYQQRMIPFDSFQAKLLNKSISKRIREASEKNNELLAELRGARPMPARYGINHRFCTTLAIAPTGSNSLKEYMISPACEPYTANVYTKNASGGNYTFKNPNLAKLIDSRVKNLLEEKEIWSLITRDQGSVINVPIHILSDEEKEVFRTASEISMFAVIEQAADRTEDIDQSQSVNLFFDENASWQYIHDVHIKAWESGVKTLYYMIPISSKGKASFKVREKDECIACQ